MLECEGFVFKTVKKGEILMDPSYCKEVCGAGISILCATVLLNSKFG
jgi:hypothetical protein